RARRTRDGTPARPRRGDRRRLRLPRPSLEEGPRCARARRSDARTGRSRQALFPRHPRGTPHRARNQGQPDPTLARPARATRRRRMKLLELLGLDLLLGPALAGDLLEERAHGRSAVWYWRQVLIAVITGVWRTIFDHKLLALRALATGWAVNGIWLLLWRKFLTIGLPDVPQFSFDAIATLVLIILTQAATGWIIARTHRAHAIPLTIFVATVMFAGWLIGSAPEAARLFANSLDQPRFRLYLAWLVAPI